MSEGRPRKDCVAVIGGGIIGLSVAWRLTRDGRRVTVFDQSTFGSEASWAGAGMLAPGGEMTSASPLASLAIESRRLYAGFVRELRAVSRLEIDYQDCGALDLAYTEEEARELDTRAQAQQVLSIPSKAVPLQHVAAFWPRVRTKGLVSALFYPEDGIVDPRDIMRALREAADVSGIQIAERCPVRRILSTEKAVTLETGNGIRSFDLAVVAAGAWSSMIEVQGVAPLPWAEPVKGHLIGYRQPQQTCSTIVRHGHSYLLQRSNGFLIAGASVERAGFDRGLKADIADRLAAQASDLLPHLAEETPSEVWMGFRPAADSLHIGRWQSSRLFLAYGHYRNGILLAPATAEKIAAEINASSGMN